MIERMDRNGRESLLLDTIQNHPGIQFREIMRKSGLKNGVVSHYLRKLERSGTIRAERSPRQARFYLPSITHAESKAIKALRRQTARDLLLTLIARRDGMVFGELVRSVKKSPSTVSLYLSQIVRDELVEIRYENLKKMYYVKDVKLIDRLIEEYRPSFLERSASEFEDVINSL